MLVYKLLILYTFTTNDDQSFYKQTTVNSIFVNLEMT